MKKRSIAEYFLVFEAWIFLSLAKLMILFISFKKIASKIGMPQIETDFENKMGNTAAQVQIAVARGTKYVFFASKCYDQALATTFMLRRRQIPSTIYFGLNKKESQLSAHAWVRCGQLIVSGKQGYENFTPITWFGTQSKL